MPGLQREEVLNIESLVLKPPKAAVAGWFSSEDWELWALMSPRAGLVLGDFGSLQG